MHRHTHNTAQWHRRFSRFIVSMDVFSVSNRFQNIMVNRYLILLAEHTAPSSAHGVCWFQEIRERRDENVSLPPFYICIYICGKTIASLCQQFDCIYFCWCNFAMMCATRVHKMNPNKDKQTQPTNQPSNEIAMEGNGNGNGDGQLEQHCLITETCDIK